MTTRGMDDRPAAVGSLPMLANIELKGTRHE